MPDITWIRTLAGTPVADNFGNTFGQGSPIVIDSSTDTPYYLKAGVATPIGSSSAYRPLVDGSVPPNLMYEPDGSLIMEAFTP